MPVSRYFTAFCLYLNYMVHGIGVLIISLNMHSLEVQWSTDAAGVSVVISSLGLGRFALLYIAGTLSDRWGRKPFVLGGIAVYMAFFIGLLFTHDLTLAYVFGFLAGSANSLLDAGTYPKLMELFPDSPGPAVILIKAFVASGQFILPLVVSVLAALNLWYGWSFIAAAAVLAVNFVILLRMGSRGSAGQQKASENLGKNSGAKSGSESIAIPDLVSYTLFGYVAMATFYLVSQWLAQYGEQVAGMDFESSLQLLSIYTTGSICGVFLSSLALKTFLKAREMLLICTVMSFLSLLVVTLWPTSLFVTVFAFVFGFFAAGGVLQLGLTLLAAQFPSAKGKATGIYYSAGSISNFTIPLITAWIARNDSILGIFRFDVVIAAVGVVLACFIAWRSRRAEALLGS
ncbi:MFS transporter [Sutterella faecalis]|uniref:MFS transporter n=3 Tax=Sutterella TaxID=40544 RepID=A0AAI9WNZ2_9BURK|nr:MULTISPECIES: MFS transporter [Sutterella]KAB7652348.1 MFS transporter [Sutterella seckii]QDA53477.1 MFS transporter [Sutterella faecalis]